jgi:NAD(P)-dependent dehydrogenase (short-subunit alcohol dehydrogenase family)
MGLLYGKIALVTGSTSGIGAAAARALAAAGAAVVVAGRRAEKGEEVAGAIRSEGHEARFVRTDVTDEAQVAQLIEYTVSEFGRLDIAFNNAGGMPPFEPLETLSAHAFADTIALNLASIFYSLKHEIHVMRGAGGSIINTASPAGLQGYGHGMSAYVAAKHGVIGLTRCAALEAASHHIRVNAIVPGVIGVERLYGEGELPPAMVERIVAGIPLGRVGTVDDVNALVLFLASDAASFITGAILPVDGGETAGVPKPEE